MNKPLHLLLAAVCWLLSNQLSHAQTFQKTYPAAASHNVVALAENALDFLATTKSGLANATLAVKKTDGTQTSFTPGVADCDIAPLGGVLGIGNTGFFDFYVNGNAASPPTTIQLLISPVEVGNLSVGALQPGQSLQLSSQVTVPANFTPGTTAIYAYVDPFNLIAEPDEFNNTGSKDIQITGTGGGGGQIDLSLALVQTSAMPAQWSNYSVKATLTNSGGQAATGVRVKFAKPVGVVYTGGNEFTASQGSFSPFGNEEWNVGSLPANGSATLTVNYFLLQTQAPVAYAHRYPPTTKPTPTANPTTAHHPPPTKMTRQARR